MNVTGGPDLMDMLSLLNGASAPAGAGERGGLNVLSPLLHALGGSAPGGLGGGSMASLLPLLQAFGGGSGSGGLGGALGGLSALSPLLQTLHAPGRQAPAGQADSPGPVIDVEPGPEREREQPQSAAEGPAAEDTPPVPPQPDPPRQEGPAEEKRPPAGGPSRRGRRSGNSGPAFDPALLQLLRNLGELGRQQQQQQAQAPPPPPDSPEPFSQERDFDPCAECGRLCPRRNAAFSFDQVKALAATFPAYP